MSMSKRDEAIIKAFKDYSDGVTKCINMGPEFVGILHFSYYMSSLSSLRLALRMPVDQAVTITIKSSMTDAEYVKAQIDALMAAAKDAGFSIEKA